MLRLIKKKIVMLFSRFDENNTLYFEEKKSPRIPQ